MAVGDFTIDSATLGTVGHFYSVQGTIELDTNATTSAILSNGTVVSFAFNRNLDDDDGLVTQCHINSSDFAGTVANGSVHCISNAGAPDTYAFTMTYLDGKGA